MVWLGILAFAASALTESADWPRIIALRFPSAADETRVCAFRPLIRPRGTRRVTIIRGCTSFLAFGHRDAWRGHGISWCCGGHFYSHLR